MGGDSGGRRLHAFRSLAGNRALLRLLSGYALFILTEYAGLSATTMSVNVPSGALAMTASFGPSLGEFST